MKRRTFLTLGSVALPFAMIGLGGCSKLKKLTGQTNDTVLPGQREDILPPDQHTAKSEDLEKKPVAEPAPPASAPDAEPGTTSGEPCDPNTDPDCTVGGGVFNDG